MICCVEWHADSVMSLLVRRDLIRTRHVNGRQMEDEYNPVGKERKRNFLDLVDAISLRDAPLPSVHPTHHPQSR